MINLKLDFSVLMDELLREQMPISSRLIKAGVNKDVAEMVHARAIQYPSTQKESETVATLLTQWFYSGRIKWGELRILADYNPHLVGDISRARDKCLNDGGYLWSDFITDIYTWENK